MSGAATCLPLATPGAAGHATRRPRRLLMVCALLSALGHTALLVNGQDDGGSDGGGQGLIAHRAQANAPARSAVSTVRLLDAPAAVAPAPADAAPPSLPGWAATPTAPAPARETTPIAAPDEPRPPLAAAAADDGVAASPIARPVGNGSDTGHDDGDDRYLARSQLDEPPAAQAEIELPFPATAPLGSYRAVLTLFIDASGLVQRVRTERTEGAGLPPSLDDAARQAFLAARFDPGVKNGQPVRSRIRVEVLYSTELLPQRSASAGASAGESAP